MDSEAEANPESILSHMFISFRVRRDAWVPLASIGEAELSFLPGFPPSKKWTQFLAAKDQWPVYPTLN